MLPTDSSSNFSEYMVITLALIPLQRLIIPAKKDVSHEQMDLQCTAYLRNCPLSSCGAERASCAITFPGCSGRSSFPSAFAAKNFFRSCSSIVEWCFSRSSVCMSVSTTPGLTAIEVTFGSSFFSVCKVLSVLVLPPHKMHVSMTLRQTG